MNIQINSLHFKADKKLELFISNKIEKLVKKYPDIIGADVLLKLDNTDDPMNKITEIKLIIRGNDLFASKQSKTFEEASDNAIDALKKQLEKYKTKLTK
ncbi:MAG: HPF/RaiA family ribosome-associated protein [Bacteroidales bacterium]|jgi:putative sigma-54 modulation protein|nr:HPF/RaiA family ribosome-associated protein [Bacteroidales bacterium]MCK9449146.1 HPF/RaiA family ribosome-associated protein [Bacteroidales bacterium]MDD3701452.1 HPF/RaiA family ribosome-associated protein [Bacteroidales bacterium]MDY0369972.1 HPF/RaiA family ribosome-associated protein [Bacteroidales bacterium]